ncbi:MAG TPA: caspase family protein [Polyangiaceae bacterium]|nr:caspase family protein [Polyangiaceae bacterium]
MKGRAFSLWLAVIAGWLSVAVPAAAKVERFAVLVGANRGESAEETLRYAERDAERMYAVLQELGDFLPENMLLLRSPDAAALQRALISVNDRVRSAESRPGAQVVLFVYYSGHADAQALHLGSTRLELTLLEQLVRSSAAAFRVLVVDACRSGSLTRVKGGSPGPAFAVRVDESLDGEGTVLLTSSSLDEDSQESEALGGSFFTHYLSSGLLGPADTDGDGLITLDEAYRYAHMNTLRASSRTLAGPQHPTFRYDLKGQGRIVLSAPVQHNAERAGLRFPAGHDYLVFADSENGAVVAEVTAQDARREVSVKPGRYFVRGRAATHLLEGTLQVSRQQRLTVSEANLARVEYARLVRKGGHERQLVHGPLAAYSFRTALSNSEGLCHGAVLGYAWVHEQLTLSPRLGYCRSEFENPRLSSRVETLSAALRVAHGWDLPLVSLEVGASLGAVYHHQSFENTGRAPSRPTPGAFSGIDLAASVELGSGLALFGESGLESHLFRLQQTDTRSTELAASWAFAQHVGLSKVW